MGRGTRTSNRLTSVKVAALRQPGLYADGNRLYLRVTDTGSKSWIYRYALNGRKRDAGLGAYPAAGLRDARAAAFDFHQLLARGVDPLDQRQADLALKRQEAARMVSFAECARRFIEAHEPSWKNAVHRRQWRRTLELYVYPHVGDLAVTDVDTDHVLAILEPIWLQMPETASRVRGRIEAILDWAAVRRLRDGPNPARWRGHVDKLLPPKSRVRQLRHHPAMPFGKVPEFMARLADQTSISSMALRFLTLTAARTSEVLHASWTEIDLDQALWVVPAERMKAGREHRVPLSEVALAIVREMAEVRSGQFVFPGAREAAPLSNMSLSAVMRRMGSNMYSVHGFRSAFRDWSAEIAEAPRELAEMALAHAIPSAVEAAYRRGDLLERRRRLMSAWALYCGGGSYASGHS